MDLPSAEVLSRWTISDVNNWLTTSSLTVFRDGFIRDNIDGSKLMRLQPHELDQRYNNVPVKKRNILKNYLSKIESTRPLPSWSATPPQLPPRPGPSQTQTPISSRQGCFDDDEGSDDGWGSDDFDDDAEEDYLQPNVPPAHLMGASTSGRKLNGHQQLPPNPSELETEDDYVVPEEVAAEPSPSHGLTRKPTLVDRLKNELEIRQRESQDVTDVPPPRPPRSSKPGSEAHVQPSSTGYDAAATSSPSSHRRFPPQQTVKPSVKDPTPPDENYDVVSDPYDSENAEDEYLVPDSADTKPNNYLDFSETSKKAQVRENKRVSVVLPGASGGVPLPPRPVKKVSADPLPPPQQGGRLFNNEQVAPAPAASAKDLSSYDWYHGKIGRDHAQMIFQRERTDGMFLIRKSERDPKQPYTLVIWHCGRIWNIPIRQVENNKFAAGKHKEGETRFNSIVDLVEHFKVVSLSLRSDDHVQGNHNLTVPAPRQ